jgi:hypothetical protein
MEQQRSLFKIFALALEKDGQHSNALRILTRYFQTFKNESNLSPEVESLMKTAVMNAINSPVDSFHDRTILLEVQRDFLVHFVPYLIFYRLFFFF